MTLGLQETRLRRRRQRRWAMLKWLLLLTLLGAAGLFVYETARHLARIEVTRLEEQVNALKADLEAADEREQALRNELRSTREELADWKDRYKEEVPSGPPAEILALVRQRLDAGVPAERLGFVIAKASAERSCDAGPTTKRFIVQTPLSTGAAGNVAFADNRITVTASGASATDAQGRPEAWFDPDRPVTVNFTMIGGESETAEGTLPLHHSIVFDGQEHRFSITSRERAFVEVTWERCAYP